MNKPLLGAHVSCAGGLVKAIENAQAIGAECFQIHATSPRQWAVKQPTQEAVEAFLNAANKAGITTYYIHAPYLINLASPDPEIRRKGIENLVGNMKIGEAIKAKGVIVHLGSSMGDAREVAFNRQLEGYKEVLKLSPGECHLVLENSAGGGNKFGGTLEDLGSLVKGIKSKRVGICFDTCHAHAGGVIEHYSKQEVKKLWDDFDKLVGLESLLALHVNDSKSKFQSNHDNHENLGEGTIGIEAFENLAAEKRLENVDWILEVPGDDEGPRLKDVELLKKIFGRL